MIKSYLKIAFRALWRNKRHSLINILGLSLGIACCVLIVLYVKDEWTFDAFHSKAKRIYRVYAREDWGENQQFFATVTPFPMGPTLKENFPEVEKQVRINNIGSQVKIDNNLFNDQVTIGGQDFFDVFDFDLMSGDRASVLRNQSAVIITERIAQRYFGNENPIDKVISLQLGENFEDFSVKGVAKNIPTNSSIQFDLLISDLNYPKLYSERALTSVWFNVTPETYILLQSGVDPKNVEAKFPSVFRTILGEKEFSESKYAPGLQSLTSIHLNTNFPAGIAPVSNPRYSYILAAIALLILSVACINFVTLSIGRSLNRAKEVGIRKVLGAQRQQLIFQFIGEAMIITSLSILIGIVVSALNLPLFNNLAGKQLLFPLNGFLVLIVFLLLLIIGLIAGSYPALVLSGFKPIAILKGAVQSGRSKQGLRRILVGVQLVLSIFLISSTLVMKDQFDFLQNKNLGFDKEQLAVLQLSVPPSGRVPQRVNAGFEKAEQFKTELSKIRDIAAVCASSHDFGNGNWVNVGFTDDKKTYHTFNVNTVDDDYLPTLAMVLIAGRNFSDDNPADKRRSVIVNEAFVKEYGWTDALGKKIPGKGFLDHEIIGVVKDFNYTSLYTKVQPLVMVEDPQIILSGVENINVDNSPIPKLIVRLRSGNMMATINQVKAIWDRLTAGEEFSFTFVDQALAAQYRTDQNLGKIVSVATLLAIVIGSLGLYGLASLAMQSRIKEISIRKVLGATEQSLLVLLSKEYVVLIAICIVLSVPITIYLMMGWLASFEYRTEIGAGVFLLAGGISLLIAISTISYQAIRTAWTQPAETLKQE